MRLLVTGASGFTGKALIRLLSNDSNVHITGVTRNPKSPVIHEAGVKWVSADILNRDQVSTLLGSVQPEAIIHLAGLNHGSHAELFETNVCGTQNLLEAVSVTNCDCRVLVTSSSSVYGYQGPLPLTEDNPFQPLAQYGVAKAAQDILSSMYYRACGVSVTVARPFNLAGPGQTEAFICGKIVKQVVEYENGTRDAINLFETQSSRDFIDVRDAVKAYWALITHPRFHEECAGRAFNVGSGRSYPISEVIAVLEKITGKIYPVKLPDKPPQIVLPSQQSDISRILSVTGWTPQISFEDTLRDMLAYERARSRREK